MNPMTIRFGDEVGPITARMCGKCGSYVYENLAMDPWDKFDVWVFLCLTCDERLMPFMAESQQQIDDRANFVAKLKVERFKIAQEKAHDRIQQQEQMTLWD